MCQMGFNNLRLIFFRVMCDGLGGEMVCDVLIRVFSVCLNLFVH